MKGPPKNYFFKYFVSITLRYFKLRLFYKSSIKYNFGKKSLNFFLELKGVLLNPLKRFMFVETR